MLILQIGSYKHACMCVLIRMCLIVLTTCLEVNLLRGGAQTSSNLQFELSFKPVMTNDSLINTVSFYHPPNVIWSKKETASLLLTILSVTIYKMGTNSFFWVYHPHYNININANQGLCLLVTVWMYIFQITQIQVQFWLCLSKILGFPLGFLKYQQQTELYKILVMSRENVHTISYK